MTLTTQQASFFEKLLCKCGASPDFSKAVLKNKKSRAFFRTALTHPSADLDDNYERLEFIGDMISNECVGRWIFKRFPDLRVGWMSTMKQSLISQTMFASFARSIGLEEHIVAEHNLTNAVLEDVFEASMGAIVLACDNYTATLHSTEAGMGMYSGNFLCNRLIFSLLDDAGVNADYESVFPAKSRLKEIFEFLGVQMNYKTWKVVTWANTNDLKIEVYIPEQNAPKKLNLVTSAGPGNGPDVEKEAAMRAIKILCKQFSHVRHFVEERKKQAATETAYETKKRTREERTKRRFKRQQK